MKKTLIFILIFLLLFTPVISVSADDIPSQKEEVIYGILNLDGSVNNLYVVNVINGGAVTDYGDYSDIRNMTNSEKLNQDGDKITINTSPDKFYYQGTMKNKDLPWDIAIHYYLDGREIQGADLAGKSGKLKITLTVKQNSSVNSSFFDDYALQIGLSLDNKLCSNIESSGATAAEAGSKKQLTYTVLPGKGADIAVTADVHDFEMDAVTINGIKLSLNLTVDTGEFTEQISELTDAIKGLDDGAGGLLDGLNRLSSGMQEYIDGMKAFKDGLGQLSSGADKLDTGAQALKNGLSQLTAQNASLLSGAVAIQQGAFDSANAQLKGMGLNLPALTPENYSAVLSQIPNLTALKQQLDGAVQFTQGLKGYLDGAAQLCSGASDLASGTEQFKSSSSAIASSADELYNAAADLNAGIKKLRDGLASYKNGTKKLKDGTAGMDSQISDKVDEILGSISGKGGKVISFVSDKNTNVSSVQFVLKTDSITLPEAPKTSAPETAQLNFWQKLLKLFGLYI